jgi:hypothetical protein
MIKFTLPNKSVVMLRLPLAKDVENLDKWLRLQYMQQANEVMKMLPDGVQKEYMLDVMEKAMILSSQFSPGRDMLFANVYGVTRFVYSHIQENTTMTFEQFHEILFPDGFLVEEGQVALADMLRLAYPDNVELQQVAETMNEVRNFPTESSKP